MADPTVAAKGPTIETISRRPIVRGASTVSSPRDTSPTSPLLTPDPRRRPSVSASVTSFSRRSALFFLVLVLVITVIIDIGGNMMIAPGQRILESIICKNYYRAHNPEQVGPSGEVPEKLCKIAPVQKEMATLRGWVGMVDALPSRSFRSFGY